MKGYSLIWHTNFKYAGSYVSGLFSDNNILNNPKEKSGWGIKLDLPIGPMAFPVKYIQTFFPQKKISEIPFSKWNDVFGRPLANRLRDKLPDGHSPSEVHDFKYGIYNPWKAKFFLQEYMSMV